MPSPSSPPSAALVELRDVHFGYGQRPVLSGLSLTVPRGKVTAIMGASGGGKTTVLRLIGGQQRAQRGEVLFDGQDVGAMDVRALYAARRRMGMLFQYGALFTDMSVFENVAFPLREHTDLPEALARSIALDPELIMYDEPFAGLDPISLGTTAQLIRKLNDAMGLTTILVSHDLEATLRLADHVIILGPGTLAAQGTADEVRRSTDPLVHQFVNALPTGPVPFHYPAAAVQQDFGPVTGGTP